MEIKQRHSLAQRAVQADFPHYKTGFVETHERMTKFLADGFDDLVHNTSGPWLQSLEAVGCWFGADVATMERMFGGVVAGSSAEAVVEAAAPARVVPPHKGFTNVVVVPFCDVYNRPRSLMMFNRHGESWHGVLGLTNDNLPGAAAAYDHGLCFLDQLEREEEAVYAVGGARFALQLRCQHMFSNITVVPIIGWLPGTLPTSWAQVKASRTILWSPRPDADLFKQARYASGKVSMYPRFDADDTDDAICTRLREMTTLKWQRTVEAHALPWYEATARWLLSLPADDQLGALCSLNLDEADAAVVADSVADATEKATLAMLFGLSDISRSVVVNRTTIVQDHGKWTTMSPAGASLILDAVLYLDRIQHPVGGGDDRIVGHVERAGKIYPFNDRLGDVEADAGRWLNKFFLSQSLPLPQIGSGWSHKLWLVAQAFHNPPVKAYIRRVGHVEKLGMIFPRFIVREGRIITEGDLPDLAGGSVPGSLLDAPNPRSVIPPEAVRPTPTAVTVWSILRAIAFNMEAQTYGAETKGIAVVVGDDEDGGYTAVRQIARSLNLPWWETLTSDELLNLEVGHVLPPIVDMRGVPPGKMAKYLWSAKAKSCMVLVSDLTAWTDMSLGGWIAINGVSSRELFPYPVIPTVLVANLVGVHNRMGTQLLMSDFADIFRKMLGSLYFDSPEDLMASGVSLLESGCNEHTTGDIRVLTVDTDRAVFPLVSMAKQTQREIPFADEAEVIQRIPAGPLLRVLKNTAGVDISRDDIAYALRTAGLLRGTPGAGIDMSASDWNAIVNRFNMLIPPRAADHLA